MPLLVRMLLLWHSAAAAQAQPAAAVGADDEKDAQEAANEASADAGTATTGSGADGITPPEPKPEGKPPAFLDPENTTPLPEEDALDRSRLCMYIARNAMGGQNPDPSMKTASEKLVAQGLAQHEAVDTLIVSAYHSCYQSVPADTVSELVADDQLQFEHPSFLGFVQGMLAPGGEGLVIDEERTLRGKFIGMEQFRIVNRVVAEERQLMMEQVRQQKAEAKKEGGKQKKRKGGSKNSRGRIDAEEYQLSWLGAGYALALLAAMLLGLIAAVKFLPSEKAEARDSRAEMKKKKKQK